MSGYGRKTARFTDDSKNGVATALAGGGYQRSEMDASLPRPADPEHKISQAALLSPGGVAGKVGGFYKAPQQDEYGAANKEAARIKARMVGNDIFAAPATGGGGDGGYGRGGGGGDSRRGSASRAPWGMSGDAPEEPLSARRRDPAPWEPIAPGSPESKPQRRGGRGRSSMPTNQNTDHISYDMPASRVDPDQAHIAAKIGSGAGNDAAADMAAFAAARDEAQAHKRRQQGGALW